MGNVLVSVSAIPFSLPAEMYVRGCYSDKYICIIVTTYYIVTCHCILRHTSTNSLTYKTKFAFHCTSSVISDTIRIGLQTRLSFRVAPPLPPHPTPTHPLPLTHSTPTHPTPLPPHTPYLPHTTPLTPTPLPLTHPYPPHPYPHILTPTHPLPHTPLPHTPYPHRALAAIGLIVIAMGTGGIKPCVSAFGGDQFKDDQGDNLRRFFSLFYFSINAGSVISTLLTPVLRSKPFYKL